MRAGRDTNAVSVKYQTNTPSKVTLMESSLISPTYFHISIRDILGVGAYRIWWQVPGTRNQFIADKRRRIFLDRVKIKQPKKTKSLEEVKLENVNFIATLSF